MNQHQIRILNYPETSSDELFVRTTSRAYALARNWADTAVSTGLESLLFRNDQAVVQDLIGKARDRHLLSLDGCKEILGVIETCEQRIAKLADFDASATRSKARVLNDTVVELYALLVVINEALDLEAALNARHRLGLKS